MSGLLIDLKRNSVLSDDRRAAEVDHLPLSFRLCDYGDFSLVKAAARYSARDNKPMVPISALLKIAKAGYKMPKTLPVADTTVDAAEPI
jgi:hypothetical protein